MFSQKSKLYTSIVCSFFLSFVCINVVCCFYNHDAKWLWRDFGATDGIYAPGHWILQSDEGFGFHHVDDNGYVNSSCDLADQYIICYGNSHTNAVQVMPDERYVGILDKLVSKGDERTHVYAVAKGGTRL